MDPVYIVTGMATQTVTNLIYETSSNESPTSNSTQSHYAPNIFISLDLAPFIHLIPFGFPNLDSFTTSIIAKITMIRNLNARSLDPDEVSSQWNNVFSFVTT